MLRPYKEPADVLWRVVGYFDKDGEDGLALVVVGYRLLISHSVQPVVARNYLYCGIYFIDRYAEAKFKVAHDPLAYSG
jgi:hypothetical protein